MQFQFQNGGVLQKSITNGANNGLKHILSKISVEKNQSIKEYFLKNCLKCLKM